MKTFDQLVVEAKNKGDGDCMVAAANLLMNLAQMGVGGGTPLKREDAISGKVVMVHALVRGQGAAKGRRFSHAWVEHGNTVYDHSNGKMISIDRDIYYAIGGIKPKEKGAYFRYTFEQMRKKMLSTGHYGPWEIDEDLEENMVSDPRKIGRKRIRVSPEVASLLKGQVKEAFSYRHPRTGTGVRTGAGAPTGEHQFVEWNDLKKLESMLDAMFGQAGLDITFTKHLWERINGSRGYGGTVSIPELQDAFRKTFVKYGQKIRDHRTNWKAIILDISKQHLNIPFVLDWNPSSREMSLVVTTAMKKQNFISSEPKLPI